MVVIKQYLPFITKHLKSPLFVLDIGAYKGEFTEMIKGMYPESEINLFEPTKYMHDNLLSKFPKETVFNLGIADREKTENYVLYKELPALNRVTHLTNSIEGNEVVKVNLKSLDALYNREIDLCKIDTEGLEFDVFKGAKKLLKNKKIKFAFFECGETYLQRGYELKDIIQFLAKLGYSVYAIRENTLVKLDKKYNDHHLDDYLATHIPLL